MKKIITIVALLINISISYSQRALVFDRNATLKQQVFIPNITCPETFTFEMWVRYLGQDDIYSTLLEFEDDAPYFGLDDQKLTLYGAVTMGNNFPIGEWTHVAVSYSSISKKAMLYLNGKKVKESTDVEISINGKGAGIAYNQNENTFNGEIDEVRIWEVERTELELKQYMNLCLTGEESGLYALYSFEETVGFDIIDGGLNEFNGKMRNMDGKDSRIFREQCPLTPIQENQTENQIFSITPNPAFDYLSLPTQYESQSFNVLDVFQNIALSGKISNNTIAIENLKAGVYFIKLENGKVTKFVKQ